MAQPPPPPTKPSAPPADRVQILHTGAPPVTKGAQNSFRAKIDAQAQFFSVPKHSPYTFYLRAQQLDLWTEVVYVTLPFFRGSFLFRHFLLLLTFG